MKNRICAIVLSAMMLVGVITSTAFATTNTVPNVDKSQMTASAISAVGSVYLNNVKMTIPDGYGYFWVDANGRTQAPVRALVEAMGYTISYNRGVVTVPGGPKGDLKITIGSNKLDVGGTEVVMDTIGATIDGRTYVPLRYVSEALGATVEAKGTANGLEIHITNTFTPARTIDGVANIDLENCKNLQTVVEKYAEYCFTGQTGLVRMGYLTPDKTELKLEIRQGVNSYAISGLDFGPDASKQYEMVYALIDDVVEESSRQQIKDLIAERSNALADGWTEQDGYSNIGKDWVEKKNGTTQRIGNVNVTFSNYTYDILIEKAS